MTSTSSTQAEPHTSTATDTTNTPSPSAELPTPPTIIHDEHAPGRRFAAVYLPDELDERESYQNLEWEEVLDSTYDYLDSIFQCGIPVHLWQEYAAHMRRIPIEFNADDLASIAKGYATTRTIYGVYGAHAWDDAVGNIAFDYVKEFLTWCVTYMAPLDLSTHDFNDEIVDAFLFQHQNLEEFLLLSFTSLMVYAGADVLVTPMEINPNTSANTLPADPMHCVDVRVTITPPQIPEEEDD